MIALESLVLGYGDREIVHGVSLRVEPGELLAIVGANGSGKSTLLRGMARLVAPRDGRVLLGDADIRSLGSREVARRLAILPQSPELGLDITVEELVSRGRYPHQSLLRGITDHDLAVVASAMAAADVTALRGRSLGTLSGGERQRAWIALALAQEPEIMLLDEPTSALDLRHRIEVMETLRRLNRDGMTIVAVLHDLMLATRYADRVVAMRDGSLVADGSPAEVFAADVMSQVFGTAMLLIEDPVSGNPIPVPAGPAGSAAGRNGGGARP